jgi:hypothetical protein
MKQYPLSRWERIEGEGPYSARVFLRAIQDFAQLRSRAEVMQSFFVQGEVDARRRSAEGEVQRNASHCADSFNHGLWHWGRRLIFSSLSVSPVRHLERRLPESKDLREATLAVEMCALIDGNPSNLNCSGETLKHLPTTMPRIRAVR